MLNFISFLFTFNYKHKMPSMIFTATYCPHTAHTVNILSFKFKLIIHSLVYLFIHCANALKIPASIRVEKILLF